VGDRSDDADLQKLKTIVSTGRTTRENEDDERTVPRTRGAGV
jgi:hypothetical protein